MLKIVKILFFWSTFHIINSAPVFVDNQCSGIPYENLCVKLGSKYYLIDSTSQLNWFEAERFCRRQNAFLANIESANEWHLISDYLESKDTEGWYWLSGNDLGSEGTFYSIATGRPLSFNKFTKGQPDNAGGNENCVHLWRKAGGFVYNDVGCHRRIHFICELQGYELSYINN